MTMASTIRRSCPHVPSSRRSRNARSTRTCRPPRRKTAPRNFQTTDALRSVSYLPLPWLSFFLMCLVKNRRRQAKIKTSLHLSYLSLSSAFHLTVFYVSSYYLLSPSPYPIHTHTCLTHVLDAQLLLCMGRLLRSMASSTMDEFTTITSKMCHMSAIASAGEQSSAVSVVLNRDE